MTSSRNYANIDVHDLYKTSFKVEGIISDAERWVFCENMMEIRLRIIQWWYWIEDGSAEKKYPDPTDTSILQERADKFISELEDDMLKEKNRWKALSKNAGPGFDRLLPHARIAMAQDIMRMFKPSKQIRNEAGKRVQDGEHLPPLDARTSPSPAHDYDPIGEAYAQYYGDLFS
jgi:hypothetical protein